MTIEREDIIQEFAAQQTLASGTMVGGGAGPADIAEAGGSSGEGGYGLDEDRQFATGGSDEAPAHPAQRELSRGERYDMEQGGGRASDAIDFERELKEDQHDHQDQGQRFIDEEGAVTEGQQP